eukprot:CAMPEP_0181322844 /NCGR_PEP_ID=MMETSP1101-20121128/19451_1 /TAXON_ID=46948 /ORGANISM="Rhodomonas abbreviata, Strain Caron Lab Isolate" /LENGTH=321 /DNA_ID=CAMNT_0023430797 /DNA_START=17 /DNA_END=982 /DNA_ORIENTATION=+
MLKTVLCLSCFTSCALAFNPSLVPPRPTRMLSGLSMQTRSVPVSTSSSPTGTPTKSPLTKELFAKLDVDQSGTIDADELAEALGGSSDPLFEIFSLMARADLNRDGKIDYAEYERLMAMDKFSDENGGNLFVRNAIKFGMLRPDSVLADCVMVGNKGFDPLNCATSMEALKNYREAELKHGRLAMLAAAGWPISELLQPYAAKALNLPVLLAGGDKAPSLLNGGLDKVNPMFFMGLIIFTATIESIALRKPRGEDWVPGDLGFDPLNLYTDSPASVQRDLELKELNNGRLAMLAITGYVLEEFLTKASVVNDTPFLFKSFL